MNYLDNDKLTKSLKNLTGFVMDYPEYAPLNSTEIVITSLISNEDLKKFSKTVQENKDADLSYYYDLFARQLWKEVELFIKYNNLIYLMGKFEADVDLNPPIIKLKIFLIIEKGS